MKTAFGMTAVLALFGMSILSTAETADARGTPRITTNATQTGPRIVQPRIKAQQTPSHKSQRGQVNGPRESGRGVNCRFVNPPQAQNYINPRTGRSEVRWVYSGPTRCPLRI